MLWLALTGRDGGVRCSDLIGVASPTVALDLDLACSYRLMQFENKREYARMKAFKAAVKEAVAEIFSGTPTPSDTDDSEPELSEDDVL